MKCPKCGYLELDPVERCRHCGYRFSLSTPSALRAPELPLRAADADFEPLEDLALVDAAAAPPPAPSFDALSRGSEQGNGHARPRTDGRDAPDLPLFMPGVSDDAPLITRASPPRPPLSVRRATPEVPRLRTDRSPLADTPLPGLEAVPRRTPSLSSERRAMPRDVAPPSAVDSDVAPIGRRILATAIDLALLLAIDGAVIYFTLQIGGVSWGDRAILPQGPLLGFLIAQNLGYFVAFAAGGQTLGQMATGVKVVATDSDRPPSLASALLRTVAWTLLVALAGLGLLTAIVDPERRGLHDRLARTRVVRA